MCRIVGIWNKDTSFDLKGGCLVCRDTMTRGGPDDAGLFIDCLAGVSLGHRRLSIIDLTPTGRQPMSSMDGRFTITYNGEIYNYREIRESLESSGFIFRGTSDTEVALNAFAAWGPSCVDRFIGMFAFAIWDGHSRELFLFRDRLGIKPLYFYHDRGMFAFASELKAIHACPGIRLQIDRDALSEFFHYGYISWPRSIYQQVSKLEPGCWIRVKEGLDIEHHRYWDAFEFARGEPASGDENALADRLEEILVDAFTKRLIADVPVGVFLSGGVDSSLVTAILTRHADTQVRTFTIGFSEKSYDESRWAELVAGSLGTEHTMETATPDHAREILPLWPEIYDEPFGDISGVPTAIVSRITAQHVKVCLSADGGDEQFCGYHRYWVMNSLDRFLSFLPDALPRTAGRVMGLLGSDRAADLSQAFPRLRLPAIRDRMRKLQAVLANWGGNASNSYPYSVGYWLPHEVSRLTGAYQDPRPSLDSGIPLMDAMMLRDLAFYLPEDILTKVDRATMFNSLEGRDPFLDHRIVEFALALPIEYKYRSGESKYLLKKILRRYLPEELFSRPKQGFAVPIHTWLRDDLMGMVGEHLNPDTLRAQGDIDPDVVMDTLRDFKHSRGSSSVDRVWLLLVFMMFRQRYAL